MSNLQAKKRIFAFDYTFIEGVDQSVRIGSIYSFINGDTGLKCFDQNGNMNFWEEDGPSNPLFLEALQNSSIFDRVVNGEYLLLPDSSFIYKRSVNSAKIVTKDDGDRVLLLLTPDNWPFWVFEESIYPSLEGLKSAIIACLESRKPPEKFIEWPPCFIEFQEKKIFK